VLVVKILKAELQGRPEPLEPKKKLVLQLVKFTAEVENVITGIQLDNVISFYFFLNPDQSPRYWLEPGKRYVVFLRDEDGALRTMADCSQLALRVYSGRHAQRQLPTNLGPGPTIVYVLLVPGSECNFSEFGMHLAPDQLDEYASPRYIASLMSQLQQHAAPALRDRACLATAQAFWFRPPCLASCVKSSDAQIRETATVLLSGRDDKIGAPERLRKAPLSLMPTRMEEYIEGRLEMFTSDVRPEVRRSACEDLGRLFPVRRYPQCK